MYILTEYTTDRNDLDLIPSVVMGVSQDKADMIKQMRSELIEMVNAFSAISSPDFDENETFVMSEYDTDKELFDDIFKAVKKYDAHCLVIKNTQLDYESVLTINVV